MTARKTTWTLRVGNALHEIAKLDADSVDCCVTSPPYWGLRDYGDLGQEWPEVTYSPMPGYEVTIPGMVAALGQEPEPAQFIGHLVLVFREVMRVLKPSGTLWLNMGDTFANDGKWGGSSGGKHATGLHGNTGVGRTRKHSGLKPKDLCMIPSLVTLALRTDGWHLRSDIIWAKPNPMPESVTDRPTKAHEYVFLLAASERYFYNAGAVREPDSGSVAGNGFAGRQGSASYQVRSGGVGTVERWQPGKGRNARTVWTITPEPFPGAHFATMPPALAERCIKAGCPLGGTVLDPFTGSGTVGAVARSLGRSFVGTDLSPEYAKLATERLTGAAESVGLIDADSAAKATRPVQLGLFAGKSVAI